MLAFIYNQTRNGYALAEHACAVLYAVGEFGPCHAALSVASGALLILLVMLLSFWLGEHVRKRRDAAKQSQETKGN